MSPFIRKTTPLDVSPAVSALTPRSHPCAHTAHAETNRKAHTAHP
jgi:hypothetical protein